MKIAVIDGQGGGLGRSIVSRLKRRDGIEIIALGTNSQATSAMMKAGAHRGATGVAKRALAELDLDPDAKPAEIRARYADYVRRFHPDSNKGDRSSEEKLARVIRAGKTLKAAGLMKDAR